MAEEVRKERSPGIKLLLVGLVGFILMVPLLLVYALVYDRQDQSQTAQTAINSGWGGPQVVAGPVIAVPFRTTQVQSEQVNGQTVTRNVEVEKYLYISPVENKVATTVNPQLRRKSIYSSVLYESQVSGTARFEIPADLPRFAKLGVIASMQPVHQTSDRLMAEARLGPNRLNGAYAWHSMQLAGVRLAFGSDVPVESADPFAGMAAAFTRMDAKGDPFGGWQPQERVSREDALAGFTTGAAYASFAESRVGRLAPGYWADFILVDTDPLLATPAEVRATKVSETWIGGKRAWAAKPAN